MARTVFLIEATRQEVVTYFVRALPGLPELFDWRASHAKHFKTYGAADQIMQTLTRRSIPGVEHKVVDRRVVSSAEHR